MLRAYREYDDVEVFAFATEREAGPFLCFRCREEVVLHKGLKVVHHFKHKKSSACTYKGESRLHLQLKQEIFEYIKDRYAEKSREISIERVIGTNRADVYVESAKGYKMAIEIQCTTITPAELLRRTQSYHKQGVYVLWIQSFDQSRYQMTDSKTKSLEYVRLRLKEFELLLFNIHNRTLFFWSIDKKCFCAVNFEDQFAEDSEFYDSEGEPQFYPGEKLKTVKRTCSIEYNIELNDFRCIARRPTYVKELGYDIPAHFILHYDTDYCIRKGINK